MSEDKLWEEKYGELVSDVLDPVTRYRIGGHAPDMIRNALIHVGMPHVHEWWKAQGESVVNDALALVDTDLPDEDVIRVAVCAVAAVVLAGCPLHHHIVRDVLAAALTREYDTRTRAVDVVVT